MLAWLPRRGGWCQDDKDRAKTETEENYIGSTAAQNCRSWVQHDDQHSIDIGISVLKYTMMIVRHKMTTTVGGDDAGSTEPLSQSSLSAFGVFGTLGPSLHCDLDHRQDRLRGSKVVCSRDLHRKVRSCRGGAGTPLGSESCASVCTLLAGRPSDMQDRTVGVSGGEGDGRVGGLGGPIRLHGGRCSGQI